MDNQESKPESKYSIMSKVFSLTFETPILIEEWEKFCRSNGLSYAEHIGKANVFVGHNIEITLGEEGKKGKYGYTPPQEFDTLKVVYNPGNTVSRSIIMRIAERFKADDFLPGYENVSVEEALKQVKAEIEKSLLFEQAEDLEMFEGKVRSILEESLFSEKTGGNGRVGDVRKVYITWEMLYPCFWKRLRAKFAFKILHTPTFLSCRPSRLMRWFGFKAEQQVRVVDEASFYHTIFSTDDIVCGIEKALLQGSLRIKTFSKLAVPHSKMEADIYVSPIRPVDKIHIDINVSK